MNDLFFATRNGHLECLKYLHEKGCPWGIKIWNEDTCVDTCVDKPENTVIWSV